MMLSVKGLQDQVQRLSEKVPHIPLAVGIGRSAHHSRVSGGSHALFRIFSEPEVEGVLFPLDLRAGPM